MDIANPLLDFDVFHGIVLFRVLHIVLEKGDFLLLQNFGEACLVVLATHHFIVLFLITAHLCTRLCFILEEGGHLLSHWCFISEAHTLKHALPKSPIKSPNPT